MKQQEVMSRIAYAILVAVLIVFVFFWFKGYNSSIGWNVTTTAESESFYTLPFQKGPFQFSFEAEKFELAENFTAGPITRNLTIEAALTGLILLGLCMILAVASTLSRFWFLGISGAFIFFLINLHLPEVGLYGFGPSSSVGVIILMASYILPLYLIHEFKSDWPIAFRILAMVIVTILTITFSGVPLPQLHDQFISGSYFGLVVLSLIFLLAISEEIIFGILFLITQSKGGKSNHVHFSIFSTVYLGIIIAYYGNKAGFWDLKMPFFNPYFLLLISTGIALWSIRFKNELIGNIMSQSQAKILLASLGITVFSYLAMAFQRGNDPVYEGLHYFIVYTHVAFGVMFFLYLFWNFISPLGQGLQVYKIAYKSQSFPYATSKIGAMVAVAGFFFLANKEALVLFQAGSYNYRGAQVEATNNAPLATEYYREGSIYGFDNHFSNYHLGYKAMQSGNVEEANYRFKRASRRYPSPQSYINLAGTFAQLNQSTPTLVTLQEGNLLFPGNNQISNNLGLTYADMGNMQEAVVVLEQADPDAEWTDAALVNLWKVVNADSSIAIDDYNKGSLAAKTNILSNLLSARLRTNIQFDSSYLYPSFDLHRLTYLINASWYFDNPEIGDLIQKSLSGQMDEKIYFAGRNAMILSYFKTGQINRALQELDYLINDLPNRIQGDYLNKMGLIALSQHANFIALDFFRQAAQKNNQDAFTNQLACLLEMGQFEGAKNWADQMVRIDSGFVRLQQDIERMIANDNLTPDQQLFRLYYNYQEYAPGVMNAMLSQAGSAYCHSLWTKVAMEQLTAQNYEQYKTYRAVFNNFLDPLAFEEPDALLAIAEKKEITNNHPLKTILASNNTEEKTTALARLGKMNALNEPLVLAVSDLLGAINPTAAYDVLVEAININKTSVALHKKFILSALENGLETYAREGLQKLTTITTQSDYQLFLQQYESRKAMIDAESGW